MSNPIAALLSPTRVLPVLCAVALALAGCDSTTAGLTFGLGSSTDTCYIPDDSEAMIQEVIALVNSERHEQGLSPVTYSASLSAVADDYACNMIEHGFFGHDDPITGDGFAERMCQTPFRGYPLGENLAAGQHDPSTVFEAWMNSSSHRRNILGADFKLIGLSVRSNSEGRLYWVQQFAGDPPARVVGCDPDDAPSQASGDASGPPSADGSAQATDDPSGQPGSDGFGPPGSDGFGPPTGDSLGQPSGDLTQPLDDQPEIPNPRPNTADLAGASSSPTPAP